VARDFGPDGPQPSIKGEQVKKFVSRVGGVSHNLSCLPQGPGGVQVLEEYRSWRSTGPGGVKVLEEYGPG